MRRHRIAKTTAQIKVRQFGNCWAIDCRGKSTRDISSRPPIKMQSGNCDRP